MIATTEKIEYGKEIIEFELLQEDRKTLSIEVLPLSSACKITFVFFCNFIS